MKIYMKDTAGMDDTITTKLIDMGEGFTFGAELAVFTAVIGLSLLNLFRVVCLRTAISFFDTGGD